MLLLAWLTQTAVHASPPGPIGNDPGCYPDYYGPVYVVWDVPEGQIDGAKIYRHIQDSSNSTVYEEWELIATLYTDENGVPTSFEDSYSECASLVDDYMTGNVSYSIILFNGDGDSSDGPHPGFGVFGY